MNKKEISIFATKEQVLFENVTFYEKTCRYFYEIAVKARKRGDKADAIHYWKSCKEAFVSYEKASSSWNTLFSMKGLLGINTEKYYDLMDKKQILPEKGAHMSIKTEKFDYRFLCNIQKTSF